MSTAHGGQILLSQTVVDLVGDRLPDEVALRDLGAVRLRDLAHPERVYQVLHPQLRQDFPALRSLQATPNNLPQQVTSFIGREQSGGLQRLLADPPRRSPAGRLRKTRMSEGCRRSLSISLTVPGGELAPPRPRICKHRGGDSAGPEEATGSNSPDITAHLRTNGCCYSR